MAVIASRLVCSGCGYEAPADDPAPFRCPNRGDGRDHVLRRRLSVGDVRRGDSSAIFASREPNPFLRYRPLLHSYRSVVDAGGSDADFVAAVEDLDRAVTAVEGHGIRQTPFAVSSALADALGVAEVWCKDETGNVAGSHKARHLFGLMLWLRLHEEGGSGAGPLAIASCGNAALAAGVVARAAGRMLDVFVPPRADRAIIERLGDLGARLISCSRQPGEVGDPCYLRFRESLTEGALPFTCQGSENALTLDGGRTLAWEMVSELTAADVELDRLFVQVGGGALASSCIEGLIEARDLGVIQRLPRLHAVQTVRAHPLERAYHRIVARLLGDGADAIAGPDQTVAERARHLAGLSAEAISAELTFAADHRGRFMWPWEEEPVSVADGILDDETYDWLAVIEGMLLTGGYPVTVSEDELREANELARSSTAIAVSHTGSAGLAGALQLARSGELGAEERLAVLLTGVART